MVELTRNQRLAAEERERKRVRALGLARTSLWFLLTDILGYYWNPKASGDPYPGKGLTDELHRPLCAWLHANRKDQVNGIWLPRWHHKTTMVVGEIIQDILRDPTVCLFYFHAVDEQAQLLVSEVAWHLQNNMKLRALDPIGLTSDARPYRAFPAMNAKKWIKVDQFTVNRQADRPIRFPTLLGKGAGSEITGAHANKCYADDIIGRRTLEDSQLPKIKSWWQNTVMPVVDDGIYRVRGTRWDISAIYEEWIVSKQWSTIVLPSAVSEADDFITDPSKIDWSKRKIELKADYDLTCPIYGPPEYRETQRKKLEFFQREMGLDFATQMMNDPSPAGEKPWDPETCEHYLTRKEASGPGIVVALSDPAPAKVGSADARAAKYRADGSKDDWATAIVKLRRVGERNEIILLDGRRSKEWDMAEGFDEFCRLAYVHGAHYHAYEAGGSVRNIYEGEYRKALMRQGVKYKLQDLKGSNVSNAKNVYFASLTAAARAGEFFICQETCDRDFLKTFLEQVRNWRPMAGGKNGLRYDDCGNVVSMVTDPVFRSRTPAWQPVTEWSPFQKKVQEDYSHGSRYVRW